MRSFFSLRGKIVSIDEMQFTKMALRCDSKLNSLPAFKNERLSWLRLTFIHEQEGENVFLGIDYVNSARCFTPCRFPHRLVRFTLQCVMRIYHNRLLHGGFTWASGLWLITQGYFKRPLPNPGYDSRSIQCVEVLFFISLFCIRRLKVFPIPLFTVKKYIIYCISLSK